ncbi:ABC transporter substrate-binding protein [Cupriavidus sp. MP-37]|uniref:substrate-binding periplasmic protein n=1 Tax=Cupriavidus sp. MP-37 TaxID=2884455 RepID=UPI001D0B7A4F|nr:transporter substrate-binding domain-containing protein [Cupriavidus sp. MP-37]UDM49124.1 transporter substrate-binding domain-containing protein [Cupriavidus sp. MP-37]
MAAAAILLALAAAVTRLAAGPILVRMPEMPERLPAPWPGWLAQLAREPEWRAVPAGPVLAGAVRRGELVVGVRAYPRPAPPNRPTPPEPDAFDVEFGRYIAARLDVRLRVVALQPDAPGKVAASVPGIDLVIAGSAMDSARPASASSTNYTGGKGGLVALRGGPLHTLADLAGKRVCVASGSPYASELGYAGALPRIYASAIHAVSAFMAGDCEALAEDEVVLDRLMGLPEWRFYRRLEARLTPAPYAQMALSAPDTASQAWIDLAARHWKAGGAFAGARERRAANVGFEVGLLQNGLVCHS